MEFNELDAGDYTVKVWASNGGEISGVGKNSVEVVAGESASCEITMRKAYSASAAASYIQGLSNAGDYDVIVAKEIDNDGVADIKAALQDTIAGAKVNLDLSWTTGLTEIAGSAFKDTTNKGSLAGIVLPEGIKSIGNMAFMDCAKLKSIVLPDGIESIGTYTFRGCAALTSIVLPDDVKEMGTYAFSSCSALVSIEIPKNVTSIGAYTFANCTALETVIIPNGVTEIGERAFQTCNELANITIPDSVEKIAGLAFLNCSALESIVLPEKLTEIIYNTFQHCSNLISIYIPVSVKEIDSYAFDGCDALTTVNYGGTEAEWENITIKSNNDVLSSTKVTIICTDGTITNNP